MAFSQTQRVTKMLKQATPYEPVTEIGTGLFLPNHSGIKSHPEFAEATRTLFGLSPIGTVIAFHEDAVLTTQAGLDNQVLTGDADGNRETGWYYLNGQTLSILDNPNREVFRGGTMNVFGDSIVLPDANGTASMLRSVAGGGSDTGTFAGSDTHSHTATTSTATFAGPINNQETIPDGQKQHTHTLTTSTENNIPRSMRVKWIMRID